MYFKDTYLRAWRGGDRRPRPGMLSVEGRKKGARERREKPRNALQGRREKGHREAGEAPDPWRRRSQQLEREITAAGTGEC